MKRPSPKNGDPFLVAFGIYGGVGFQLAASVVGGLLIGQHLDQRWGLSPWLTMSGLVLGATGGFYNLVRILNWNERRREGRARKPSGARRGADEASRRKRRGGEAGAE